MGGMFMDKMNISLSLDEDVVKKIRKNRNASFIVNRILRRAFLKQEGIKAEIKYHEECIKQLNKDLEMSIEKERERLNNLPEGLNRKLSVTKKLIMNNPEKERLIGVWTDIINREYDRDFSIIEFKMLLEMVDEDLVAEEDLYGNEYEGEEDNNQSQ